MQGIAAAIRRDGYFASDVAFVEKFCRAALGKRNVVVAVAYHEPPRKLAEHRRTKFDFIVEVYNNGGNIGAFKSVIKDFTKKGIIPDFDSIACSKRDFDTINPWDFILQKNPKEQIVKECKLLLARR